MEAIFFDSLYSFTLTEVKAEYEALPVASSFTRAEVAGMVEKIQESAAFDTDSLSVLSLNEIVAR